jgi:hypothetical protein
MLKNQNLSPEAAQLLADIEQHADRLMPLVKLPGKRLPQIWARPPPQEQAQWLGLQNQGGQLLHTQVCIVTAGASSDEWCMGQFFISEKGIAVHGASGEYQAASLCTGLLSWDSIQGIESEKSEVKITLNQSTFAHNMLRLQLGIAAEGNRIRQAWHHYSLPTEDNDQFQFHSFTSCNDHCDEDLFAADDCLKPHRNGRMAGFRLQADAPITTSFHAKPVCSDQAFHETMGKGPICTGNLANVSLETVRRCLEKDDDWFLCRFQTEILKAFDFSVTPWTQGQLIPGTLVRKMDLKLPAPDDVPKAVAKMIGFPPVMDSVLMARLHSTKDQITLLMHSNSLNVPYGDCQRIEDVLVFTPDENGGVNVAKWIQIGWIKAMPWTLSLAKSFLQSKVTQDASKTWDQMMIVMREELTRKSEHLEDCSVSDAAAGA